MKKLLLIISIILINQLHAQTSKSINFEISGTLVSNSDKLPLESATVYLETKKDSTLISYTLTNDKGAFLLEGKTKNTDLKLSISYVGFKPYSYTINLAEQATVDLKQVALDSNLNELNTVVLKGSPPVLVKKDTLEFNVRSFKTKKDANVEDLLKKLPGIEVDSEGKITVNGKPVNKVLINGKPFFGNDPTIATKNFPKDIIEKIQVLDTKSKSEAFTGEESDGENKTVNLVVKEENNKGVFGRTAAGIGTDERYQYAGMYNRFDNDQKISVLAGGNNVNSPGFSYGEIRDMFGSSNGVSSRSLARGRGITTSDNAGINYSDDFGKNVEFNSNYFYSNSDSENKSKYDVEETLEDLISYSESTSNSSEREEKHTANLEFDIKRDSTWLINISPSFNYELNKTHYDSKGETFNGDELSNESNYDSDRERDDKKFSTKMSVTRNYGSGGGFISFRNKSKISNRNGNNLYKNEAVSFEDPSLNESRNQNEETENSSYELENSLTYRLPIISKKLHVDFKHTYIREKLFNNESTFDYNTDVELYNSFNTGLSQDYTNVNQSNVSGVSFSYKVKKLSIRLANYYRFRTLDLEDNLRSEFSLKRDFNNFEQYFNFRYKFNSKSSVSLSYNYENRVPSIRYLQEFEDTSSIQNTRTGNSNLKLQKNHNINANFNYNDHQKNISAYGYVWGEYEIDKTVSISKINTTTLYRETTYTNLSGDYYISGSIQGSKKFKFTDKSSLSMRLGIRPRYSRSRSYNNEVLYTSTVSNLTPSFDLSYDWIDVLEVSAKYNPRYTSTIYDNDITNQSFTTHAASFNTTTRVPKKLEWSNSLNYTYNPNVSDGFQKSSWFWNMTLSYSVFKDNGLISLKAVDILNQNTNVYRWAYDNRITNGEDTVLKQYFMLGFSWKFNTLGKRGKKRGRNKHQVF